MSRGWVCKKCGQPKAGFWEDQYGMSCRDCRDQEATAHEEERLRKAVASGKVKISQLTELGLRICGIEESQ